MILQYPNGTPFASGATEYLYQPAHQWDPSARILVPVKIEDVLVTAMVDTGAPFVVCPPDTAREAGIVVDEEALPASLQWHGLLTGHILRRTMTLLAEQGQSITVEARIFVPDAVSAEAWEGGRRAFVLGMGCLESVRFAVDPDQNLFYFGEL